MRLCAVRQAVVRIGFVALLVEATSAQQAIASVDPSDIFRLFNACRPVTAAVFPLDWNGRPIPHDRVGALVERRLRFARLYGEEWTKTSGHLSASYFPEGWHHDPSDPAEIRKVRLRIAATLRYHKRVTDEFGNSYRALTWESRETVLLPPIRAIVGGDGEVMREYADAGERAVSELLDEFIDEYLRVNGEACDVPAATQP